MVVEEAFEVAGHLNVHGGGRRAADLAPTVAAGSEELGQDVVFVGGDDQAFDGKAHALGHEAGEHVAEIAGGHAEGRRRRAAQAGVGVVEDLGEHSGPVDGVHGAKGVPPLELQVGEYALHQGLAVVKAAGNGQAMHVGVRHCGHLQFLQAADPALGIHDEDVDARLAAHAGDGRAAGVAAGGAQNVEAGAAPLQDVGEQAAKQLQGDVLERQGWAVEELKHADGAHRLQPHHLGTVEAFVGLVHQGGEVGGRDVIDELGQQRLGQRPKVQRPQAFQFVGHVGNGLRQQQPPIRRQAGDDRLLKPQRRRSPPSADVAHGAAAGQAPRP